MRDPHRVFVTEAAYHEERVEGFLRLREDHSIGRDAARSLHARWAEHAGARRAQALLRGARER